MVGVRDDRSGSKRHGQGGDKRLGWEGHRDEHLGLRRHGQGGRQAFGLKFEPSMSTRMSARGRKRTHICRFAIVVLVIVAIIVVVVVVAVVVVISSLSQDEGVVVVVVACERMGVYMNAFSFGQSEALSVQPRLTIYRHCSSAVTERKIKQKLLATEVEGISRAADQSRLVQTGPKPYQNR